MRQEKAKYHESLLISKCCIHVGKDKHFVPSHQSFPVHGSACLSGRFREVMWVSLLYASELKIHMENETRHILPSKGNSYRSSHPCRLIGGLFTVFIKITYCIAMKYFATCENELYLQHVPQHSKQIKEINSTS